MKAKTILLTLLLSLSAVSLWAQEKYDFLIVKNGFLPNNDKALFIASKENIETIKIEKQENSAIVILKKIDELQSMGWEVYETDANSEQTVFFLRKKKN